MNQMSSIIVVSNYPMGITLMLLIGIVLCSLLCVMAAFRKDGEVLRRQPVMLLCQVYLVLGGMFQLANAGASLLGQVSGFVVMALGLAPIFLWKKNFDVARYCIGFDAALSAIVLLLI